ncbi:hypothetical protein FRB93_006828 [Tulasnella sp. JGI-2019a]|nr:hypothetical protein FRB93_006828 [Tulasnella sp. JGI-2019a]
MSDPATQSEQTPTTPAKHPWTPSHRNRPSWQSLTSTFSGASRSPLPPDHDDEVDLDDAFDDADDAPSPEVFRPGHISLHRESSLGTAGEIREASEDRVEHGEDGEDDDVTVEVDLNDNNEKDVPSTNGVPLEMPKPVDARLPSISIQRTPSTKPRTASPSYPVDERSPYTPSIVLSRPASPHQSDDEDDTEDAPHFVNVSLSASAGAIPPNRSASTSPRSPIPRKIVIHPPGTHNHVILVQGPPTPISVMPDHTHEDITNGRNSESYTSSRGSNVSIQSIPLPSPVSSGFAPSTTPKTAKGRSKGISTLDVISKTRPTHLPPKAKEEDLKHMKDWEEMMQKSREAEELRQQKVIERRMAREKAVEASAGRWEREVLPDWKAAMRDPKLKRLWWDGIPTKLRGKIWALTLGNALALSKDAYKSCLSRAKRAITTNSFPPESMQQIEEDISRTLPTLHLFHNETGPMYQDLKDLLCAWLVARSDEGLSYVRLEACQTLPRCS